MQKCLHKLSSSYNNKHTKKRSYDIGCATCSSNGEARMPFPFLSQKEVIEQLIEVATLG